MAYRNPTTRFPRTVLFTQPEINFLQSIIPWSKKKWSGSFGNVADHAFRNQIKAKIKTELAIIQNNYCAFCGLDLTLTYATHREHIAPQYKHPYYIFEPENLVLACNFCNMYKGKKLTVINDTRVYSTTTFKIFHPFRDDYSSHFQCDFQRRELIFTIISPDPEKAQRTIDCIGLNAPALITQRGAIVFRYAFPVSVNEDMIVKQIVSLNRR